MAVRLIVPSWMAFFKTGATLHSSISVQGTAYHETSVHLLWRVCRVNNDGVFGLVIHNKISVVVGTTNP